LSTFSEVFLCYIDIWFLTRHIFVSTIDWLVNVFGEYSVGICFVGRLSYDIHLNGFIDLDWEGSEDDKRNATWICFSLRFATMSWDNKNHKSFSLSTIESEYIVACDSCTEVMWLRKLVPGPSNQVLNSTMIYCNDQSYVNIS
jgi:hypothetical protein